MLLRLLALPGAAVEPAEPEVAVGDEGAHAELLCHRERLPVEFPSTRLVWSGLTRRYVAEGIQALSLEPAPPGSTAQIERLVSGAHGLLGTSRQQIRLGEEGKVLWAVTGEFHRRRTLHRLFQKRNAISQPPDAHVGAAEERGDGCQQIEALSPAGLEARFERADGFAPVALNGAPSPLVELSKGQAIGVIGRHGDRERLSRDR